MRLRTAALLSMIVCGLTVGLMSPAQAAEDTIDVNGTLADTRTDPPKPVPGVNISVEKEGAKIASGVSGDDGKFSIPLPGTPAELVGETITIKLDAKSLPKGTTLTEKGKTSYEILIKTDFDIPVTYRIGPKKDTSRPLWEKAAERAINGVFLGLLLAMAALGLSLVFGTTGLANFAHGELITFGALAAYLFQHSFGWAFWPAAIIAVVLSGAFGYANDRLLWKPLRARGTGLIAMMIVSIGLGIFLRNIYQYFFGADNHTYRGLKTPDPWQIGRIDIRPKEFYVALVCVAILVVVSIAVQRTRLGKATRAVSDNPALAASSGIDVDRVITTIWIVGAALAGTGGIMWGTINGFDFQTGLKILLIVFAAVTLGGLGTIWGTMLGALLVGLLIELSSLVIAPEVKYVSAFVVLVLVLLLRPQGLLGRAERVG